MADTAVEKTSVVLMSDESECVVLGDWDLLDRGGVEGGGRGDAKV
jgi:hypothetical protein